MPYIIDGNNLVGSSPDIALEDPEARNKVIEIVRQFQQNRKNSVTVVFDGEPGEVIKVQDLPSKFNIVYPRNGITADDEIKHILEGFSYFKDVVLVSSDRALKDFARKRGAKTINAIEFYYELKRFSRVHGQKEETLKRIEVELSDSEVDQWMKIFDEG